jgi:hypothetical protein
VAKVYDWVCRASFELKNMAPRIHILFEIKNTATGGGNQFLRALRDGLQQRNRYAEQAADADMFLFNSHQHIEEALQVRKRFPEKPMVHRIDGPIRLYNASNDIRDMIVYTANRFFADATIFQSAWSRAENVRLGLRLKHLEIVIPNAPDPAIFNREGKIGFSLERKIKLIASSWSANWKKGFEDYLWLDGHLDFSRYEMTFVGNSPVKFKRIKTIPPLSSRELASELKKHDVYITASQKDPCSNSLIEALSCGLPALVFRDGGHPAIVGAGGDTFVEAEEIPALLERMVCHYEDVQRMINIPGIDNVVDSYCCFCDEVFDSVRAGAYQPHKFTLVSEIQMRGILNALRIKERITSEVRKLYGYC